MKLEGSHLTMCVWLICVPFPPLPAVLPARMERALYIYKLEAGIQEWCWYVLNTSDTTATQPGTMVLCETVYQSLHCVPQYSIIFLFSYYYRYYSFKNTASYDHPSTWTIIVYFDAYTRISNHQNGDEMIMLSLISLRRNLWKSATQMRQLMYYKLLYWTSECKKIQYNASIFFAWTPFRAEGQVAPTTPRQATL